MRVVVEMTTQELSKLQYGIIVEAWDKRTFGKGKRTYLAEFTKSERVKIGRLHTMFYAWYNGRRLYLHRGTKAWHDGCIDFTQGPPLVHNFDIRTLAFIQRVVRFFATI